MEKTAMFLYEVLVNAIFLGAFLCAAAVLGLSMIPSSTTRAHDNQT